MAKAKYLTRQKGKRGYSFTIAIPRSLWDRFLSKSSGKPLRKIVEGLGTDSLREAEAKAVQRLAHWKARFERAEQATPLSLREIDELAQDAYRATLEHLERFPVAVEPQRDESPEEAALSLYASVKQDDIEEDRLNKKDIDRAAASKGATVAPGSETYYLLGQALLYADLYALENRRRAIAGSPFTHPETFLGAKGIDPIEGKPLLQTKRETAKAMRPMAVFERWVSERQPAAATVNRWRPVFLAMDARFGANRISEDEAWVWVRGLVDAERSARTVRDTWLSASKTVYGWGTEHRIIPHNPFAGVKVTVPKSAEDDNKSFSAEQAALILREAMGQENSVRRWVPWLAAYSGARAGELCQLRAQDIDVKAHTMKLTPEAGTIKTRKARTVPLHEHLIAQGFLDFVAERGDGPLFYDAKDEEPKDRDPLNPRQTPPLRKRAELAAWVRKIGVTDKNLSPNHAWRHTFKQVAERAGISERISDAITGHAPTTAGRAYGKATVEDMAAALGKFPRYKV
jgi:integrase